MLRSLGRKLNFGVTGRQTSLIFGAQLLNAVLGLFIAGILTRLLSVSEFGLFSLVVSVVIFLSVFFDFGLSSAGMRWTALASSRDRERVRAGVVFTVAGALGLAFILAVAISGLLIQPFVKESVVYVFLVTAPFVIAIPMQEAVITQARGSNRIGLLAGFLLLPRIFFLATLFLYFFVGGLSLELALIFQFTSVALAVGIAVMLFRPSWRDARQEWEQLKKEISEFGRHVYYGRIVDGLTNGIDKILLSFFHGVVPVGFYSISLMLTNPITTFSQAMSTSAYKSFTTRRVIPRKIIWGNTLWCIGSALFIIIIAGFIIPLFFTSKFESSIPLVPYLAAGSALAGMNAPYHAFLLAHRLGKQVKIMSWWTSGTNVALNIILVPLLSATGAGIAMISSYGLNLAMNLYYYRQGITETLFKTSERPND
ncbi:MAG: oligosaccharide flippase family protein [Chlorobi bacterium]|nr:oligosaccharide flippase family protein [Chlorobiota bacterium]